MANNFESNFTRKLAPIITKSFETKRTISKNVDTQLLEGRFKDGDTGKIVDFKRPTDYRTVRSPTGAITGADQSDIVTGKSSGVVQDYFTVYVDYDEADEALKMAQKNKLVNIPMMDRLVVDMELDYSKFMMENTALLSGVPGTAVGSWGDVAKAGATLLSSGVPQDAPWCYGMNPFTQVALADQQRSLGTNPEVSLANDKALVKENFAGMRVMACTTLASYGTGTFVDRAGTLAAAPDPTYVTAKDTMTQVLSVTGLQASNIIIAGTTITVAGSNRLNLSTRQPIIGADGSQILWSGTVTESTVTDGAGAATLIVTGPGIFEAAGQYNTISAALANGAVVTLGGSSGNVIQPNLFWHKQAFSIGSVPIKKLQSTDTLAKTHDGLMLRVSMGSDFLANKNAVRIDFRPAYAVLNPFFAGQGFGNP